MKLRRLLLLQPHSDIQLENGSATIQRDESDWDMISELDRLRTTNSGLTAEVQRQTHIGQDYARVASEQRVRVEPVTAAWLPTECGCGCGTGSLGVTGAPVPSWPSAFDPQQ